MTDEELNQAKYLLTQASERAAVKILQVEGANAVVQRLHFVSDGQTNDWKITIEKV